MRAITVDPGDEVDGDARLLQRLLHRPLPDGGRRGAGQAVVRGRAGVRVLVIGVAAAGESAIAWACRASRARGHHHRRNSLPRRRSPTSVIVGPETALAAGVADECKRRRHPVLRTDRRARPARVVEGLRPRARDRAGPAVAATPRHRRRPTRRWPGGVRSALPVVVKQDGLAARQGRRRAVHRRRDRPTAIHALIASGTDRARGAPDGPECRLLALCDGTTARAAADRPGPQAHRRGRHRARTPAAWAPTRRHRPATTPPR